MRPDNRARIGGAIHAAAIVRLLMTLRGPNHALNRTLMRMVAPLRHVLRANARRVVVDRSETPAQAEGIDHRSVQWTRASVLDSRKLAQHEGPQARPAYGRSSAAAKSWAAVVDVCYLTCQLV